MNWRTEAAKVTNFLIFQLTVLADSRGCAAVCCFVFVSQFVSLYCYVGPSSRRPPRHPRCTSIIYVLQFWHLDKPGAVLLESGVPWCCVNTWSTSRPNRTIRTQKSLIWRQYQ